VIEGVRVKVCGVTDLENAVEVARCGVNAIGLNFVSGSPREVAREDARRIASALPPEVWVVGVVANMDVPGMRALKREVGLDAIQMHGDESPETVAALAPFAWKAIRVSNREDVRASTRYLHAQILYDARSTKALGGTGERFDWALLEAREDPRPFVLAGGLDESNVAEAVERTRPWMVDVASGVEAPSGPRGIKDIERVRRFVHAARRAKMGPP